MKRTIVLALALAVVAAACGDDDTSPTITTSSESTTATAETAATSTPTGSNVAVTDTDGCPDGNFLIDEVNAYEQSGDYPDPELAVRCDGGMLIVETNNIPNFEFVQMTPNALAAQDNTYEIPVDPTERATEGAMGLGQVGVSVTGLDIFAAYEAPNDGYRDPFLDGLLDFCNGHTAQAGQYHFHARFDCIFDDPDTVGLVFGYLFDGYEMVSPWVCANDECTETRQVTSSYVRVDENSLSAFEAWEFQEGSGDLDICNGMTGSDGVYRYYITDEFPYVPFCFHGETTYAQGDFVGVAPAGGAGPNAAGGGAGGPGGGAPPPPPGG
jgi:hypothetical protein